MRPDSAPEVFEEHQFIKARVQVDTAAKLGEESV